MKLREITLRGSGMTASFDDGSVAEVFYKKVGTELTLVGLSAAQQIALSELTLSSLLTLDPRFKTIGSTPTPTVKEKAQYQISTNTNYTDFGAPDTYTKVIAVTSAVDSVGFSLDEDNKAIYTGTTEGKQFKVQVMLFTVSDADEELSYRIAKNDSTIPQSQGVVLTLPDGAFTEGGSVGSVYIQDIVTLSPGDYIEIYIANLVNTNSVVTRLMNVIIEEY